MTTVGSFVGLTLPPQAVGMGELNEAEIRVLDGELEALCVSVDDVFARPASRQNLRAMVRGLLSEVPRKNMWQLAEFAGHPNPDRLQGFLAKAAWDADELRDRVRVSYGSSRGRTRARPGRRGALIRHALIRSVTDDDPACQPDPGPASAKFAKWSE